MKLSLALVFSSKYFFYSPIIKPFKNSKAYSEYFQIYQKLGDIRYLYYLCMISKLFKILRDFRNEAD